MLAVVALMVVSYQKEKARTSVEDIAVEGEGHGGGGEHAAAGGHGGEHGGGEHGGGHGEGGGKKSGGLPSDTGKIIPQEGFQVNLATAAGSQPRYLKMNMSFEMEQGQDEDELKVKTPKVRDAVINILNSKKAADISSPEGRDLLKEQVKQAANGYLKDTKIKNVYFSNFVISQ
jgi:flagellar FliL protein